MFKKVFQSAAVVIGVVGGTSLFVGGSFAGAQGLGPAEIVNSLIPGSTSDVRTAVQDVSGEELHIQLANGTIPSSLSNKATLFALEDIGWKARLAASAVNENDPTVSSFVALLGANSPTGDFSNFLHGGFLPSSEMPAMPNLDTISTDLAIKQLRANVQTLTELLPTRTIVKQEVTLLPINPSSNEFALSANITILSGTDVTKYFGDFVNGLSTGLTGDLAQTSVEGLEIVVTFADGTPIVGSWQSTRSATGTLQFGDTATAPTQFQETGQFQNLTGGPSVEVTAIGAPVQIKNTKGVSSATQEPGNGSLNSLAQVHTSSSSQQLVYLVLGLLVLVLGFTLVVKRQRRTARLGSRVHSGPSED